MKIDVGHTAKLANLNISSDEEKKFQSQLSEILSYIQKLKELDTNDISETSQVTGLENVTREDTASPSLSQEEAVSSSKKVHNGLFVVKRILE